MNMTHPLIEVEIIFNKMRPVTPGLWYLYAINKELGLHHGRDLPKYANIIATFTSEAINEGLTPRMWGIVEDKIRFMRKKGLL